MELSIYGIKLDRSIDPLVRAGQLQDEENEEAKAKKHHRVPQSPEKERESQPQPVEPTCSKEN
jgi:hypothetical protein